MNIAEKINVLMMGFYGNRTIVDITREKLNFLLIFYRFYDIMLL